MNLAWYITTPMRLCMRGLTHDYYHVEHVSVASFLDEFATQMSGMHPSISSTLTEQEQRKVTRENTSIQGNDGPVNQVGKN